jgi:bifunctional non-homologous end joining protein LigD
MSLESYRRKRNFTRTSEPAGGHAATEAEARAAGQEADRRFVVQRHRATRLHYDFRLEIDGVLMSWAVPRGPSMRPLERRMAAQVEDHPLDYFDFEGVIPRGEYGGGDVIVWDWGTWRPEETDDPGSAVRAGELKFELFGQKLRGRFVLVRTRSDARGRADWLLIHKRDEHADTAWEIDAHPESVKSGRTNDQVKEGLPAVWDSRAPAGDAEIDLTGARAGPMPDFVPPMLATAVDRPFSDPDWLFELKLDGYRVEAVVRDGVVRLWTRNRQDAARYFPSLAAAKPTWIAAQRAVVDGEVVALNASGEPDFSLLQDLAGMRGLAAVRGERAAARAPGNEPDGPDAPGGSDGPGAPTRGSGPGDAAQPAIGGGTEPPDSRGTIVYHVFDLLHYEDRSLFGVPLEERKKLLRSITRQHPHVRYLSHVTADGVDFHAAAEARGLEGIVAKLRRSHYEPGRRSRSWLKIKIRREQELIVVGYEPGKGSHADLGALLVAVHEGGRLRYAGEVGSGIDARQRRAFRRQLDSLRRSDPPVDDAPRLPGVIWAEPRLVIRAEFTEWTSDNLLRQAAFKGVEPEREPGSVVRERPLRAASAVRSAERTAAGEPAGDPPSAAAATDDELEALSAMRRDGPWEIGGHRVNLTNLDKLLFPARGYTKRDLITYYVRIAPVLLPHLRQRPLNVDRWPNGVTGGHFWQKQIPSHAPTWVARWDYPEAGRNESHTYIVCDRVATLAWLANQAVIDLHPWTSRLPDWWRPTYALIDIDPGERTTFAEVVTLARLYRDALAHLRVRGFPKVTGKRGIQIWVPVAPHYTFDQTRDWVMGISQAVGRAVPDLVSWEWEKAGRGGRARLDYTQNAINKTLVAPYAVRPVPGAAVSAPIAWEELDDPELRPDGWDIVTLPERVSASGDLFAGALDLDQELPPL